MRTRELILQELNYVDNELEPENLNWDGERPQNEIDKNKKRLLKKRDALLKELLIVPSKPETTNK